MIMTIPSLIQRLKEDLRIERFSGLLINRDMSVMVTFRWGSLYFETLDELEQWLNQGAKPAQSIPPSANPS